MTTQLDGLEKWERSIRDVTGKQRLTAFVELNTESNPKVIQALREMEQPEFFQRVLKRFVKRSFLGPEGILYTQFMSKAKAGTEYWPHYMVPEKFAKKPGEIAPVGKRENNAEGKGGKAKVRRYQEVQDMSMGFAALWRAITENPQFRVEGSMAIAEIGSHDAVISRLPLDAYMGTQGTTHTTSRFNNLFYAVEFGTGVADNVGEQWVRTSGDTKADAPPGAWYFASPKNKKQGALFVGQKGFHFLYDVRTRRPREFYAQELERVMPTAIIEELRKVTE